jgi:hypothetical protein
MEQNMNYKILFEVFVESFWAKKEIYRLFTFSPENNNTNVEQIKTYMKHLRRMVNKNIIC